MEKMLPSPHDIAEEAARLAFGKTLVNNVFRGLIAEVIVQRALAPEWSRPSYDWAPHDLENGSLKLEVKQSADRQTWEADRQPTEAPTRKSPPRFDIAPRTGRYGSSTGWHDSFGRAAQIYVLALHEWKQEGGDQRDPAQWQFLVIPSSRLPVHQQSIGWSAAVKLAPAGVVHWNGLAQAIAQCQEALLL